MDTVKVVVTTDKKSSIAAGVAKYGDVVVEIDLSELTQDERAELATCATTKDCSLDVTKSSARDIINYYESGIPKYPEFFVGNNCVAIECVRRVLGWRLALRAYDDHKKSMEIEQSIQNFLDKDPIFFVDCSNTPYAIVDGKDMRRPLDFDFDSALPRDIKSILLSDKRVLNKIAGVKKTIKIEELQKKWDESRSQFLQEKEAKERYEQSVLALKKSALISWIITDGSERLKALLSHGYAYENIAHAEMCAAINLLIADKFGTNNWIVDDFKTAEQPSLEAIKLFDRVKEGVVEDCEIDAVINKSSQDRTRIMTSSEIEIVIDSSDKEYIRIISNLDVFGLDPCVTFLPVCR